jgi:hypothetical protein
VDDLPVNIEVSSFSTFHHTLFNPIEECFSWIKHYIRRNGQEFRRIAEGDDKAALYVYLYDTLNQVTAEASRGWFRHSGYL